MRLGRNRQQVNKHLWDSSLQIIIVAAGVFVL